MTHSNTHPGTAARAVRRAFHEEAARNGLIARARRRSSDRVRARPRLEGLEDRCVLSPAITEFPVPYLPYRSPGDHNGSRRQPLVRRASRQDR